MATIESLPTEIIDMIVSYVVHDEFNEGRILKNLRLVNRLIFKSASRLLFRDSWLEFSQDSFPTSSDLDRRFHLEEGYQPASSHYVQRLYIYIGGKRRNQDQTDATLKLDEDGMRDSFRSFFKRLPNLRRLTFISNGTEEARTMASALQHSRSLIPNLEGLQLSGAQDSTFIQFSGENNPAMASVIAQIRCLKITKSCRCSARDGGCSVGDYVFSILEYGENLRSVQLKYFSHRMRWSYPIIHPKAPLQRLSLWLSKISSRYLSYTIWHFRNTLRYIELYEITLSDGETWEEIVRAIRHCPLLSYLKLGGCDPTIDCRTVYGVRSEYKLGRYLTLLTRKRRRRISREQREILERDPW